MFRRNYLLYMDPRVILNTISSSGRITYMDYQYFARESDKKKWL